MPHAGPVPWPGPAPNCDWLSAAVCPLYLLAAPHAFTAVAQLAEPFWSPEPYSVKVAFSAEARGANAARASSGWKNMVTESGSA